MAVNCVLNYLINRMASKRGQAEVVLRMNVIDIMCSKLKD